MIYSPAFDAMPAMSKDVVYRKLYAALTAPDMNKESRLSAADRQAILEIVRETKTGLPDYWRDSSRK